MLVWKPDCEKRQMSAAMVPEAGRARGNRCPPGWEAVVVAVERQRKADCWARVNAGGMKRKYIGAGGDGDVGGAGLGGIILADGNDLDGVRSGLGGGRGERAAGSDEAAGTGDGAGGALHLPDNGLIAGAEGGGAEDLHGERRERDGVGKNAEDNVVEDGDVGGV